MRVYIVLTSIIKRVAGILYIFMGRAFVGGGLWVMGREYVSGERLFALHLRIVAEPLLRLFLSALEILSINGLNELTSVIPYLLTSEE